ncbi:MAG: T9SS C-terminal target domain-containing protein [Candidatus Zixiibacteriota bacterium]|nr:MAG: T9SS C-terminal target domain-containing protein [candidate division Zixibacteria bacterium]
MRYGTLFLLLAALITPACATVILVPGQYPTIQAGLNAANPGDTVQVSPGVYVENLTMREGVTLRGSGWHNTTVDGGGLMNVITAPYGVLNYTIEGFEVRNSQQSGSAPGCIGIHLNPNASSGTKYVRDCWVHNCGHGIQVWNDFGGTANIEHNIIEDNLYDGFSPYLGTVNLINNTIVNNSRDGYNDWSGGGMVYIKNNVIAGNGRYGIFPHPSTPVQISYNDVWNNSGGNYMSGSPPQPFTPYPGTGEISTDPMFLGGSFGYYPSWGSFPVPGPSQSPLIDAGDPAVLYNDPDGTRADIGALFFDQTQHNVEVTITPTGLWVVPPGGGTLNYTASLINHEAAVVTCHSWVMVQLPGGGSYGPVLGPLSLSLPGSASITRLRTQNVPGSAPPGEYMYTAHVGIYPTTKWDSAAVPFTKQSAGDGSYSLEDWFCSDEAASPALETTALAAAEKPAMAATPNPFNPVTAIGYQLSAPGHVNLRVYDAAGREVANLMDGWREAGSHQVTFDASGLPSGTYFARLCAGNVTQTQKLILLK